VPTPRRRRWRIPPRAIAHQLWRALDAHAVTDSAAQLSYYLLFSLFPFLLVLTTLAAFLPLEGAVNDLLWRIEPFMPEDALALVAQQLQTLVTSPRPRLLTLGLVVTLWSASRGSDALRKALNLAYDVKETRSFWRTQGFAIVLTSVGALLLLVSITMIVLGGEAGAALAHRVGVDLWWQMLWSWARWPVTFAIVMLGAALAYYLLPDVEQDFRYVTPGSVASTLLWLAGTWGFTTYVEHFGNYDATYGSIGSVVVLLTWLWLSGLALIFGGELNAVLEQARAGGKLAGARSFGEAPPPRAERPSAAPPGAVKSPSAGEPPEDIPTGGSARAR
jgi:membrane protein